MHLKLKAEVDRTNSRVRPTLSIEAARSVARKIARSSEASALVLVILRHSKVVINT